MGQEARVKKVRPYPFEGLLTADAKAYPIQVVKLTTTGLMCDLGGGFVKVGSRCQISFNLPVLNATVQAHVVVVRTWDQFALNMGVGNSSHKVAELHFQGMSPEHREHVVNWLRAIKAPLAG
jgi:hypothetical protein